MPVRRLPAIPRLDHLRHQAKDLRRNHAAHDAAAAQRLREFHPRFHKASDAAIFAAAFTLSDAQLAIAREYGFPNWPRLKAHIEAPAPANQLRLAHHERIQDHEFRRAVDLLDAGDAAGLRSHLLQHPGLVRRHIAFEGGNYFRNPTLIEFIAENPVRQGRLPPNIVDVTRVILDAGPETAALREALMLVATGSVPRECRVQLPLIDLLCEAGADPATAVESAALLGEIEAANALLAHGAPLTLPIAAALGRIDDFTRLLPTSSPEARHLALTMAADHGKFEIVRMLLDAGEDPDRYNPIGGHSHTTPLHQAAMHGYDSIVRLLVERGARLDIQDILWRATPADWAHHQGHLAIEQYLRAAQARRGSMDTPFQ